MTKLYLYVCRYVTVLLVCTTSMAFAQQSVKGKITSKDDGSTIAGVNVLEKGTSNGAITDADGSYTINVGANATLVFSFVGFKSQEISVGNQTTIDVSMENDVTALSEVVVVGYGTAKSKDLTGSVAAIGNESFNRGLISTPEQLFQGRTPGVTITPSSGEPGAAATINIRGTSSVRGNNDPLYVIDGVPIDNSSGTSATQSGVEGSSTPKNPLIFLNPNDIESITILKDASSAAIYGSRGANGVILITTKSGKGSGKKGSFSFGTYTSIANPAKRYDLMNARDFLSNVKAANIAAGTDPVSAEAAVAGAPVNRGNSTDWQDQIFRPGGAISNGYNLSWGMSNGGTSLRVSGSYDNQNGIVRNSGLQRFTGRVNLIQTIEKFKIELSGTYSNVRNSYAPNSNNAGYQGSLIGAAISFNPTAPVHNADGSFFDPGDGNRNPAEMLAYFTDNDNINRVLANLGLSYEIAKGLTAKATFGVNYSNSLRKSFADPRLGSNAFGGSTNVDSKDYQNPIQGNGRAVYQYLKNTSYLTEETLTYDKAMGTNHLNAVAGFSYQTFETDNSATVAWGQSGVVKPTDVFVKALDHFQYSDAAYVPSYSKVTLQSYFGRVNYSINEKYYFTGTVRMDGSSKFGAGNKYGTFPAFAAKWKLMQESFASDALGKIFTDFSLRANWGKMGSQDGLGAYDAVDYRQIWTRRGTTVQDTSLVHQGNKNLKWETATTTGVGLDWAAAGGRLSGTVDYFYTQRKDLLFYTPVPGGFSASSYYFTNLPGFVVNRGIEFSLKVEAIVKSKFNWNIAYNMTFYHNSMKDFNLPPINTGSVNGQGLSGAYAQTITNGYSLFTWKMPVFQGFDGNGYAQYADGGKDQLLKSALPTFTAGLTNNFSYGNWNLSVFLNTSRGFYVYNNTANALFLKGSLKTAHNVTYAAAGSGESPINPGSVSTRFLEKGDFVRLSNVQLSYNFNINGKVIKSLSANISGQNLAMWTNYTGLDPEVNVDHGIAPNGAQPNIVVPSRGFDYAGYPKPRTFTVGLNVGF